MAIVEFTDLPVAIALSGDETVAIVQSGTSKRTTVGDIADFPTSSISFVVAEASSGLSLERVLTAESGVTTITDAGANSTITVGVATNGISDAKLRQGVARSVVGVTGNATAIMVGGELIVTIRVPVTEHPKESVTVHV